MSINNYKIHKINQKDVQPNVTALKLKQRVKTKI